MTISLLVTACLGLTGLIQPNGLSMKQQDSTRFKSLFKYTLMANQPKQKHALTLVVRPVKTQSGAAINLPIGIDERTVLVRSGSRLLTLNEGYVFVADATQIRILDKQALTSDQLTISYELLAPAYSYKSL